MWRRYLMWFAHEHIDFRHAEMQSILSMLNIPIKFIEKPCVQKPYWIVEVPSEDCIKKIASRSVLVKNCIELWSRAKTEAQLHVNLKEALENRTGHWIIPENSDNEGNDTHICPRELIEVCCGADKSFKVDVETFCKHFSMKEKVEKIENFSYLPLEGPVKLKNPDITLSYVEFYGVDPNNVPDEPYDVFFGKWVADGQRELIQHYSLKKRQFIGNTSMDAQLAILMANQAQVSDGDLLLDPFVGSGSLAVAAAHFGGNTSMDAQLAILMANQAQVSDGDLLLDPFVGSGSLAVAAAHFGGYVWGSDIDFMMLHARTRPSRVGQKVRTKDESIRSNMKQYGLQSRYLDVVVSDFSRPLWREHLKFDAIITDPPYGVREPTEKIGIERENYTLTEEHLVNHIPSKVEYGLQHIYSDLLNFAAKHLRKGRRLVCWYPLVREDYKESDLPSHPSLRLVSNSEQVLSKLTARRLLTYEKISDADADHIGPARGADGGANFRDKFFAVGEISRREKKERRAEEIAATAAYKAHIENLKNNVT